MADTNGLSQLKRKREGAEPQRKKAKTQRKSGADAAVGIQSEIPATAVTATSSSLVQDISPAAVPRKDAKFTPQKSKANGIPNPATSTPSGSRNDNKKSKGKKNQIVRATEEASAQASPEAAAIALNGKSDARNSAVEDDAQTAPGRTGSRQLDKKKKNKKARGSPSLETEKHAETEASVQNHTLDTATPDEDTTGRMTKKEKKQKKNKDKPSEPWSISGPRGGWFLPQDPIFSPDEKYLLLAKVKALEVYNTETSLLARELPVGGAGFILSIAISSTQLNQVYIADSTGIITLWDWTDGSKVGRWDIGANAQHLAVVKQPDSAQDLIYSHEVDSSHVINVHALRTKSQASKTELKRILKASRPISGVQVLLQGKIVVVSTANSVLIGKRTKLHKTALQGFEYTWREFETSKHITTFNAFVRIPDNDKGKTVLQDPRDHLDLAVGDEEGAIFLFEDIITSFAAIERSQKEKLRKTVGLESLRPKRLHWHRDAVGSVKWSLDGNYLISGGDETVLTIWQLSTGKQQHLPHLTAAIENVVVSPSGASYGISLANNSVIVLSTSELKAMTNVIGVQSRRIDFEQLPRESTLNNYSYEIFNPVPIAVVSENSSRIIFATPSSQSRHQRGGPPSEPYAQTFDMATQRPVARQALTRNNATDPNINPEGKRIREPNVKLMAVSHDGAWLATVDEWVPHSADLVHIEEGIPAWNEQERVFRREVYLKIWRWDQKDAQWILDARIDAPHFFEDVSAHARVFDLVADPSSTGFATIGEDRVTRTWRPKTRTRDGIAVRGADRAQGLVTWGLDQSIKIAGKLDITQASLEPPLPSACCLAFSADGSILAAGVSWASDEHPGIIYLVDAEVGVIRRSFTEIDMTALSGVGIIGRYLVTVGVTVTVWDLVMDQLVHCTAIETQALDNIGHAQLVRLAVNEVDGTFAVSASRFEKNEFSKSQIQKAITKVYVFDPEHSKPRWTRNIPEVVLALASLKGGKGYVALDSSSSIRTIIPRATALQLPTPPPESSSRLLTDSVESHDDEINSNGDESDLQLGASEEFLLQSENDKPVVRPEQLQQIFESGPSHALPPVRDLFDAVVGLYARKPRAVAAGLA